MTEPTTQGDGPMAHGVTEWKRPNPCGCGGCSVCGWYGLCPRPVAPSDAGPPGLSDGTGAAAVQDRPAGRKKADAKTLFDEVGE